MRNLLYLIVNSENHKNNMKFTRYKFSDKIDFVNKLLTTQIFECCFFFHQITIIQHEKHLFYSLNIFQVPQKTSMINEVTAYLIHF